MINFNAFLRPMPRPADAPGPLDETDIIDRNFSEMQRGAQQNRENARADEQMALNERHQNLQDRRQQEYSALQNREQDFREQQGNGANAEQRRQRLYALLERFQHAQTPQEVATYGQLLGQMGYPVRSLQKMEAPNAPVAPQPAPQQPQAQAPMGPRTQQAAAFLSPGDSLLAGQEQPAPKAEAAPNGQPMSAQETKDLNALGSKPLLPQSKRPAAQGIIPRRQPEQMASMAPDAGGPAPRGGGAIAPIDAPDDTGSLGGPPMLPGQSPVLQAPPEWLRQYMDAQNAPERGFLSEGDSLQ